MHVTGLPFSFSISGDLSLAAPATFDVELGPAVAVEAFDQLRCVVAWFANLADAGALGGEHLSPLDGVGTLLNGAEPISSGSLYRWQFSALRVAPEALAVLANLTWATGLDIQRAQFSTAHGTFPKVLQCDEFPACYRQLSFPLDDSRTGRDVTLIVDFAADHADNDAEHLSDTLRVWSLVCALGGFRGSGPLRAAMDTIPDDDPEVELDQLTFSLRAPSLHDAAFDALANLLDRFSRERAAVRSVTLE